MSTISQAGSHCDGFVIKNPLARLVKYLRGFFVTTQMTGTTSIYHGDFSYDLVPNTAIRNFNNITNVTLLVSGDCYIYIFDRPDYQGQYRIVGPGEITRPERCGSIIVSTQPVPVDSARKDSQAPEWCWEMPGPMYLWHFSPAYRYA